MKNLCNWNDLEVLNAVLEEGSFSRAATALDLQVQSLLQTDAGLCGDDPGSHAPGLPAGKCCEGTT